MLVRPAVVVAHWCRAFDTYVVDAIVNLVGRSGLIMSFWSGRADKTVVDGSVNLVADVSYAVAFGLRTWQTGFFADVRVVFGYWRR